MIKLNITTREGDTRSIEAFEGTSVMEAIRDNGITELQALCGGQLSCATCHVYIDPAYMDRVGPLDDYENDLLDSSDHRSTTSRLACQIPCSSALDGMQVTVAPEN